MGMGLSIARAIVQAHGGRISAGNAPDGGAILQFTLPAGRDTGSVQSALASATEMASNQTSRS